MTPLPKKYAWLLDEPGPRILLEMIKLHGVAETLGPKNNPTIIGWAKDIGLGDSYKNDVVPWCGLTVAYAAAQAGWDYAPRGNALWARNWLAWGTPVPLGEEMLGDVLVFARGSAGHVAIYVAEDKTHFHIIGGNQADAVNIKRKLKSELILGRRCPWRIVQPPNVRKIWMTADGEVSRNEA